MKVKPACAHSFLSNNFSTTVNVEKTKNEKKDILICKIIPTYIWFVYSALLRVSKWFILSLGSKKTRICDNFSLHCTVMHCTVTYGWPG